MNNLPQMNYLRHIGLNNDKIQLAIENLDDNIVTLMKVNKIRQTWSGHTIADIGNIPYICFSPAETKKEKKENERLYNIVKSCRKDHIKWFLWYHGCDEVAVLVWTILRVAGVSKKLYIVHDEFHMFVMSNGKIYDPITRYFNPNYTYGDKLSFYDNPEDMFVKRYSSEEDGMEDWEKNIAKRLRKLDK